jgi:hypothetical protein
MADKNQTAQPPDTSPAPTPGSGVWWVLAGMFVGWAVGVFVAIRMFPGQAAQPWIALAFVFVGIFVGAFIGILLGPR